MRGSGSSIEVDGTAPPDPRSKWLAPKLIAILDLGSVWKDRLTAEIDCLLIPDPLGYWFDPDVTDGSGIRPKPVAHMWRYHVKYRVAGLIPDPLGDPSPSSNRKLLVGADIFNGSGISPKEKLGKFKKSRKLQA